MRVVYQFAPLFIDRINSVLINGGTVIGTLRFVLSFWIEVVLDTQVPGLS